METSVDVQIAQLNDARKLVLGDSTYLPPIIQAFNAQRSIECEGETEGKLLAGPYTIAFTVFVWLYAMAFCVFLAWRYTGPAFSDDFLDFTVHFRGRGKCACIGVFAWISRQH